MNEIDKLYLKKFNIGNNSTAFTIDLFITRDMPILWEQVSLFFYVCTVIYQNLQ